MERLSPNLKFKLDRIDAMLVLGLFVVAGSYAMGYRLDWSQPDGAGPVHALASLPVRPVVPAFQPAPPARATIAPSPEPAAEPAVWAQDPREAAWENMTADLTKLAGRYGGRVAISLKDLKTGKSWSYHENDLFPSASLIKVPVMASVMARIQDGRISLYDKLTLRRRHRVGGSGSLKWRPDGTRLSVRELMQFMINESDNTATALLLEHIGLGYAQQQLPRFGLLYTGIYQEGMSIRGGRVAHENYTTAREMTMLMERIYRGELVDRPSSQLMFEILKRKKAVASRLAKGLPSGWEIAHKTGLLRGACHDTAIILTPDGDYALTVLTGQNDSYKQAKDFITRLGMVTYRHYGGYPRYYARASLKRQGQTTLR